MKNYNNNTLIRENIYKSSRGKNRAFCIQKDLRNYFKGAGRQSFFDIILRTYGRVEIYAALGIGLKFYALRKLTPLYFLTMVIYMGNYYVLHDFIQIRAGVSSAMLLIAIKPLTEGNRKKAFLCFLIAAVFHYSSLAFLPILFFRNDISKLWKYILIGIAPVGVVLFLLHLDFFSAIPIPYIKDKIENSLY